MDTANSHLPSPRSVKFVDDCVSAMAEARRIAEAQTRLAAELLRLRGIAEGPMSLSDTDEQEHGQ